MGAVGGGILMYSMMMAGAQSGTDLVEATITETSSGTSEKKTGTSRVKRFIKTMKIWADEEIGKLKKDLITSGEDLIVWGVGAGIHWWKHVGRWIRPTTDEQKKAKQQMKETYKIYRWAALGCALLSAAVMWYGFRHPEVVSKLIEAVEHVLIRAIDEISEVVDKLGEAFIEPICDNLNLLSLIGFI